MKDFKNDIEACIKTLNEGGLILYPTDTVWGIGCDATNELAVKKVYQLKKRPDEKAMIILVAGEKEILKYTNSANIAIFEFLQKQAKPTTVIYNEATGLAKNLIASDGSIAIRICKEPFCFDLIKKFGKPVVSTSANISGFSASKTFTGISSEIKAGVDYIVKYRQDDIAPAQPSSVVRFKNGIPEILRP